MWLFGYFLRKNKKETLKSIKKQCFGFFLIELMVSLVFLSILLIMVTGYHKNLIEWSGMTHHQIKATKIAEDFFEYVLDQHKSPYASGTENDGYTITWKAESMALLDGIKYSKITPITAVKKITVQVSWPWLFGQKKTIELTSAAVMDIEG